MQHSSLGRAKRSVEIARAALPLVQRALLDGRLRAPLLKALASSAKSRPRLTSIGSLARSAKLRSQIAIALTEGSRMVARTNQIERRNVRLRRVRRFGGGVLLGSGLLLLKRVLRADTDQGPRSPKSSDDRLRMPSPNLRRFPSQVDRLGHS